jgi:hypothetical protein
MATGRGSTYQGPKPVHTKPATSVDQCGLCAGVEFNIGIAARGWPEDLRNLAAWYREFAEKAGNPMIWELRLQMAEDLESVAEGIDGGDSPRAIRGILNRRAPY